MAGLLVMVMDWPMAYGRWPFADGHDDGKPMATPMAREDGLFGSGAVLVRCSSDLWAVQNCTFIGFLVLVFHGRLILDVLASGWS